VEGFGGPVVVCYYFAATNHKLDDGRPGNKRGWGKAGLSRGVHEEFEGEGSETIESEAESSEIDESILAGKVIQDIPHRFIFKDEDAGEGHN